MDAAVLVSSTTLGVIAVAVARGWFGEPRWDRRRASARSIPAGRASGSLVVCTLVLVASGWVLPAVVAGGGAWWAIGTWERNRRGDTGELDRIDALAAWIEHLRDVLVAGDQPIGAITSTVATCPPPIRGAVRRLAAGLSRQDPDVVFRRFADDLDDPIGDLVAAGLLIAVRRGARTVTVLSALADQARQQADRRRLVEAERAPTRREVAALTAIMSALVIAVLVFGRSDYLRPYDEPPGQAVLAVAIAMYTALLVRVHRLARFPRPARFLTLGEAAG